MDFSGLAKLGLSKLEIICYVYLVSNGGSTAKQIKAGVVRNRNSIYRALSRLQTIGFATSYKADDEITYYYSTTIEQALENLAQYQRSAVIEIIRLQRGW